jgi:hypothetical protein
MKKPMNVKLLRQIQKYILAEPKRFYLGSWGGSILPDVVDSLMDNEDSFSRTMLEQRPPCGALGCIAGTACILTGAIKPKLGSKIFFFPESTAHKARRLLGIDAAAAERLFYLSEWGYDGWPRKFERAYERCRTPRGRASVAVRRIDHFIKTKGKE